MIYALSYSDDRGWEITGEGFTSWDALIESGTQDYDSYQAMISQFSSGGIEIHEDKTVEVFEQNEVIDALKDAIDESDDDSIRRQLIDDAKADAGGDDE